jgi:hypothetical protein
MSTLRYACQSCKKGDKPLTIVYSKVGIYHYCETCVEQLLLSGAIRHRQVEILVKAGSNNVY